MSEAKWYIVHTYSGYEKSVRNNILKYAENNDMQDLIEDAIVPVVNELDEEGNIIVDNKGNPKETFLYPSYVFVKMVLTDNTWYVCRNTRGVTGFVGPGSKPIPLTEAEVANLGINQKRAEISFAVGDTVRFVSGNLVGMEGNVEEIDEAAGKAKVAISMMGRTSSAEVEISVLKKVEY